MKTIPIFLCAAALLGGAMAQDEDAPNPQGVPEALEAPIPQLPRARLAVDVEADNQKWAQRTLIAPFKARLKGEPWNAAATEFVEHALIYWADLNLATRQPGSLPQEGKKVLAAGCKDPLVLYFHGVVQFATTGEWRAGFSEMEEALKLAEADKACPRALAHFIARDLGDRAEKSGRPMKDTALKVADWVAQEWKDGSYLPGEEPLFVHHEMGRWKHFFPEAPETMNAAYKSAPLPEWARTTLTAMLINTQEHNWKNRNPGKNRPPDIVALSTSAYDSFAKAWELNPAEPWAAAEAMRFTHNKDKAAKEPSRREWFDRAVTAQFDLEAAYRYRIQTIRSSTGSIEHLLAFGRACLETRRFDTIVPSYLNVVALSIGRQTNNPRAFFQRPDVAKPLIALCLSKLREDSPRVWRDFWSSWLAIYAWLGGEPLHAERALAELKGGLHPEAASLLARMQLDEPTLRGEVAIVRAGESDRLGVVRRNLEAGERDTAISAIGILRKAAGPEAAALLDGLQQRVEFEDEFAKGGWVKLKIPDHLKGWTVVSGKWDAQGGEILLTGHDGEALLLAPGCVGNHYEIRGEVSFKCGTDCCRAFGVMSGYVATDHLVAISTDQFGKNTQNARIWGMMGRRIPNAPEPASALKPENKFYSRVNGQLLTFELNGTKHFDDYQFEYTRFRLEGRFGFVVMKACAANSWRIKNVEVRKLPEL